MRPGLEVRWWAGTRLPATGRPVRFSGRPLSPRADFEQSYFHRLRHWLAARVEHPLILEERVGIHPNLHDRAGQLRFGDRRQREYLEEEIAGGPIAGRARGAVDLPAGAAGR